MRKMKAPLYMDRGGRSITDRRCSPSWYSMAYFESPRKYSASPTRAVGHGLTSTYY
uniref:Uncharacterized protein n=1 Tax=Arundo donax TaxID=35708 RepID=A0A0A9ABY7_ARUDO